MAFFLPALAAAAAPIVRTVLVSLGIGAITYTGLTLVLDQVVQHVQTSYGQLPASAAQIADLLGVGEALGILLGAMAARVAYASMKKIGKLST
jgi:hypothetical protein